MKSTTVWTRKERHHHRHHTVPVLFVAVPAGIHSTVLTPHSLKRTEEKTTLLNEAMNFRDYASRMRTQAAAAARKIPTFDDMAAKDEYIHSEEFNVRGQKNRGAGGGGAAAAAAKPESSSSSAAAAAAAAGVDPDETSSMGSWSLLDRPPVHLRSPGALVSSKDKLETGSIPGSLQGGIESATMSANTSVSSSGGPSATTQRRLSHSSSTTLPLLSVVANTLQEHNDAKSRAQRDDDLDSGESSNSSQADDDDDDDDGDGDSMDSDGDDDENDPIMSMIRKSKPPPKKRQRASNSKSKSKPKESLEKKSNQRFMQILDDKIISSSAGQERMEAGLPEPSSSSSETSKIFGMKAPFGGWLQNAAKAQFDRILRRPEPADISTSQTKGQAPLARERPQNKSKVMASPADNFQRGASSSFMGDDELAQLAKLKDASSIGTCSTLVGMVRAYQSFAFIIFTLVLAFVVYFFQRSADDVS